MMPEVQRFLKFNLDNGQFPESIETLPLAEIFVLVGFYLIYAIEEVTHLVIDKCAGGQAQLGHSHGETQQMLDSSGNIKTVKVEPSFVSAMRGFLVVLALSLHEMFEGIADRKRSVAAATRYRVS